MLVGLLWRQQFLLWEHPRTKLKWLVSLVKLIDSWVGQTSIYSRNQKLMMLKMLLYELLRRRFRSRLSSWPLGWTSIEMAHLQQNSQLRLQSRIKTKEPKVYQDPKTKKREHQRKKANRLAVDVKTAARAQQAESKKPLFMQVHTIFNQQVQTRNWSLLKNRAKVALKFKNQAEMKPGHCLCGTQITKTKSILTSTLTSERSVCKKQLRNEEKKLSNENLSMELKIQKLMSKRMKVRWASLILNSWTKMVMQDKTFRFIKALTH